MIFWIIFIISLVITAISMKIDKRQFKNGIFITITTMTLGLALLYTTYEKEITWLYTILLGILYILIPLIVIAISCYLIYNGFLVMKKEGKRLQNMLSLIVGSGNLTIIVFIIIYNNIPAFRYYTALGIIMGSFKSLVFIIYIYVAFTFISFVLYSNLYCVLPKNIRCDFILIHGAGLLGGDRVSPLLAARIDKGIEVYKKGVKTAKLIVSGGQGNDEKISEADAMAGYLRDKGIPENHIILEDKSKTTLENMKFSKNIMDKLKCNYHCIFVTNNYHVFRTGMYARRVGLKAEGVGCKTAFYYWPSACIREYIAVMVRFKYVSVAFAFLAIVFVVLSYLPI